MPVYAYACKDCGHAFDIRQSFSDDALTVCPACGGQLRKKFNSVGVVFKGSGFYRNDSRSDSSAGGRSSGTGTAGSGDSGSQSSTASSSGDGGSSSGAGATTSGTSSASSSTSGSSGSGSSGGDGKK